MKIYDMHIHISSKKSEQNYLLEQMEKSGVYGGAIISAQPEETTADLYSMPFKERLDNVLQWTKSQNDRLFPVLWVHPEETDITQKVKFAANEGISAFKIMCDTFSVYSDKCLKLIEAIEETGKPIIFHSGILYCGKDTSKYNRPVDWECMLNFENIRFSMGHCSWPWHDECIAVYGKFAHFAKRKESAEMFFDITPGTPKIYRKELFTKLFTVGYNVDNNIMFGTDSYAHNYNVSRVCDWIGFDNDILDELCISEEVRKNIYENNFMRFLKG